MMLRNTFPSVRSCGLSATGNRRRRAHLFSRVLVRAVAEAFYYSSTIIVWFGEHWPIRFCSNLQKDDATEKLNSA
jgi:hypothetical protein